MSDVIDLNERRNATSRPDPEHVRQDEFGRPMYEYLLDYEFEGSHWSATIWAYSEEEAKNRVGAMQASLKYMGQMFAVIPA
jgi:hypothetical protein